MTSLLPPQEGKSVWLADLRVKEQAAEISELKRQREVVYGQLAKR
jgi:hypothetical protein